MLTTRSVAGFCGVAELCRIDDRASTPKTSPVAVVVMDPTTTAT